MERIKWMFIEKWSMYIMIMIAIVGLFFQSSGDIFFGGIYASLFIAVLYVKTKGKSPKIICRYCGKSLILLPISPIHFLWELIKTRQIPDVYFWVHRQSESPYCHTTTAEPEKEGNQ